MIANLHADEPSQVRSASPGRRRVATGDPHRAQHQREAVERLKEIAPRVTRVAVLRDTASPAGIGQFAAIQSAVPSFWGRVDPTHRARRRRNRTWRILKWGP